MPELGGWRFAASKDAAYTCRAGLQTRRAVRKASQSAVSRILFLVLRRGDDHSSSPVITDGIKQPTRKLWTGRPVTLPYLALLRAGFCLPSVLPRTRCALTAPFHPYPAFAPCGATARRYVFCATSPSSCPDRALPGALPCGVRTFLPPPSLAPCGARFGGR